MDIDLRLVDIAQGWATISTVPIFPTLFLDVFAKTCVQIDMDFGLDARGLLDLTTNAIEGGNVKNKDNYPLPEAAVHFDFTAATLGGGHGAGDMLIDIKNSLGASFDHTIDDGNGAGRYSGFNVNDSLRSGAVSQYWLGNGGNDALVSTTDAIGDTVLAGVKAQNPSLHPGS